MTNQNKNQPEMQPIMLDVVSDARMGLNKVAEMLTKIGQGLTAEEIVELQPELEGLAYSAAIILMDAQMTTEGKAAIEGETK